MLVLWDQTDPSGAKPYRGLGSVYTRAEIDLGACPALDTLGHGTRIASIAAGNKSGVAPEAELAIVKVSDGASDIELGWGLRFIKDLADSLDIPYVLLLCHGYRSGARDGDSDPLEGGMTRLLSDTSANNLLRGIVVAAGNDHYDARFPIRYGNNKLHARGIGTSRFRLTMRTTPAQAGDDRCFVEMWYPTSSRYRISIVSPHGVVFGPVDPGDRSITTGSPDGRIYIKNELVDTLRWGAVRIILSDPAHKPESVDDCGLLADGQWVVEIEDLTELGGIWDAYVTYVWPESLEKAIIEEDHNNYYKILSGGNVHAAVTVGSFNSEAAGLMSSEARRLFASRFPIGAISHFSSRGPTRATRPDLEIMKPELYAEGGLVEVALSSSLSPSIRRSYEREGLPIYRDYGVGYGTSEAAPHVAGAIALMVAADTDRSLSHAAIKSILLNTARDKRLLGESFRVLDIEKAVALSRQY